MNTANRTATATAPRNTRRLAQPQLGEHGHTLLCSCGRIAMTSKLPSLEMLQNGR
jgi:hypothetical protein